MAYTKTQKQRCISAIKQRAKTRSIQAALRLVSDLEGVKTKTLEDWYYDHKKAERAQAEAEAEKSKSGIGVVYPTAGSDGLESPSARLPVVPAEPPPPPVPPHVEGHEGQLRCSRCKSTSHLRQLEDGGYYCDVCQVHLPYEPVEDYEVKYTESPYRRLHWMA